MNYRLWFYITVIASFILCGFLIGVTLHAQRVSDHAEQVTNELEGVTNELKGTRYLMAANALKIRKILDEGFYRNYYADNSSSNWARTVVYRAQCFDFARLLKGENELKGDSLLIYYPEIVDFRLRSIYPEYVDSLPTGR